jgi:hypothetical protein
MSETCINCGAPAVAYCDYQIGYPIGGFERVGKVADNQWRAYIDCTQQPFTCDVGMCEACVTRIGMFHISGKDPFSDSIDHCPLHKNDTAGLCKPMTEEEATVIRRDFWAHYRRQKFAAVEAQP